MAQQQAAGHGAPLSAMKRHSGAEPPRAQNENSQDVIHTDPTTAPAFMMSDCHALHLPGEAIMMEEVEKAS